MDLIQYGQLYNEAMLGMNTLFEDMKEALKSFNKKNYPGYFESMMKKYGRVFCCIEEVYCYEKDKENWLGKLAERFTGSAEELINSKKWKFQRENILIDCNMFVVSYVLPAVNEFEGTMSAAFAQTLADCWNAKFGTQMQVGSYDKIFNGFSSGILGIKFGK